MEETNLSESIKKKRKALGHTQYQLATRAGVSEGTISKVEAGKPVSDDSMGRVLLALGLRDLLASVRGASTVAGPQALSLSDLLGLRTAMKEIARDYPAEHGAEMISSRKVADKELLRRIHEIFKEEF